MALDAQPFRASAMNKSGFTIPHATKLIIDASNLSAGWIDLPLCGKIPVWLEHGELPKVPRGVLYMTQEGIDAFDAAIWICLAEVREILGIQPNYGVEGEWLACGFIPRSMIAAQVVLQNYCRLEIGHTASERDGSIRSIRSISSAEQEEHIMEQIARNKASRKKSREKLAQTRKGEKKAELPQWQDASNQVNNSSESDSERQ